MEGSGRQANQRAVSLRRLELEGKKGSRKGEGERGQVRTESPIAIRKNRIACWKPVRMLRL
jgi:hypothetical protein